MLRVEERPPGYAVQQQVLRLQQEHPPRTRLQRALGISPLHPDAVSWYRGALGEIAVGRALAELPTGWAAVHSVPISARGTDVDHIVVGPGGVFTINTKRHAGAKVWVAGRTVMVNGQRQPYVAKAEAEAKRVRALLRGTGDLEVQPIVALVGVADLHVREAPRSVRIVRVERLVRTLRRSRPVLTAEQCDAVKRLLQDDATWAAQDDQLVVEDGWFAALGREVDAARRRRLALGGVALLGFLVVLARVLPLLIPLAFGLLLHR